MSVVQATRLTPRPPGGSVWKHKPLHVQCHRAPRSVPGEREAAPVPIRRIVLDVDKAVSEPDLVRLATAIEASPGVDAVNVDVTEIDIETVGTNVTVEGPCIDVEAVIRAIENTGAVVHSIDQVVAGRYLLDQTGRSR
jgi:hypothetical protein